MKKSHIGLIVKMSAKDCSLTFKVVGIKNGRYKIKKLSR